MDIFEKDGLLLVVAINTKRKVVAEADLEVVRVLPGRVEFGDVIS